MIKNCLKCNKEFIKPYARSVADWNTRAKYCSISCKQAAWNIGVWNKDTKGVMKANNTSFKKGEKPWNKGIPYLAVTGEKNNNWKGGITEAQKKIRNSLDYKLWREAVFKRDNYTCQGCGIRGGELNADHIKPFAWFPELRLAIDNGQTLCVPCHKLTPTFGGKSKNFATRTYV